MKKEDDYVIRDRINQEGGENRCTMVMVESLLFEEVFNFWNL